MTIGVFKHFYFNYLIYFSLLVGIIIPILHMRKNIIFKKIEWVFPMMQLLTIYLAHVYWMSTLSLTPS